MDDSERLQDLSISQHLARSRTLLSWHVYHWQCLQLRGTVSMVKRIMSQSILQRTPNSFTRQRNSVFYNSQVSHLTRTQRNMWFSCWRQNWRQHPVSLKVWEAVKTLIGPNSVLRGHNFHILHACTCYMCRCSYMLVSYALAVVQEGPEATAVEVIQDRQQEMLVKLEGRRELRGESYNSKTESVIWDVSEHTNIDSVPVFLLGCFLLFCQMHEVKQHFEYFWA